MLPLAIYLTDEFRLLGKRTLQRAFELYFLKSDEDVIEQLNELFDPQDSVSAKATHRSVGLIDVHEPTSRQQADHNFNLYLKLISSLNPGDSLLLAPQLLHPRYKGSHFSLVGKDLIKRIVPLAHSLAAHQVNLVFDLCDEARLHIQLNLLEQLLATGTESVSIGLTLNAASKRCIPALGWLENLGREYKTNLFVRILATGDLETEIVTAQQLALKEYPLLRSHKAISANYQFACRFLQSNNCTALTPILVDPVFAQTQSLVSDKWAIEISASVPLINLGLDQLPRPIDLFQATRRRAPGLLIGHPDLSNAIGKAVDDIKKGMLIAQTTIGGIEQGNSDKVQPCLSPVDVRNAIGKRFIPSEEQVRSALGTVSSAQPDWDSVSLKERQKVLMQLADLVAEQAVPLAVCLSYETGKPIRYALEEVRDAVDLAYYYIGIAADQLQPIALHSDQFAEHVMELHGRGVFLLVPSPEQPIAEILGNLTAALITGNGVVIKPPEAASLTCAKLFELTLKAMIPSNLIAFLPGGLREIGDWLLEDYRIDGVVYTGLGSQGSEISQKLSGRPGAQLIPIMVNAEGQSLAMVDSDQSIHKLITPLLEQAVSTAGQYPLSSHVVYLEHDIAERFEKALIEALPLINMDEPLQQSTDLGPVSTKFKLDALYGQIERMRANGRLLAEQPLGASQVNGLFIPPTILRLYTLDELQEVVPGPLLYLIRFDRKDIGRIINEINRTGYGLAFSLFSDDPVLQQLIQSKVRVGNLNFNHPRPRGSAGSLPIGGVGPSGTGPQIGGPNYLLHFTCERTRVTLMR